MELLEAANSILVSFQTLADDLDNPPKPRGWQTKRHVRTMKYALNRHSLDFKENVDILLGPFADSDGELANLCEDLRNVKWKDTELAAAVDREYERSQERIQDTLERMQALLDKIQGRVEGNQLSLDSDNHIAESVVSLVVVLPIKGESRNFLTLFWNTRLRMVIQNRMQPTSEIRHRPRMQTLSYHQHP